MLVSGEAKRIPAAEPATHLIAMYEGMGFEVVGRASFEDTNYESVILSKRL